MTRRVEKDARRDKIDLSIVKGNRRLQQAGNNREYAVLSSADSVASFIPFFFFYFKEQSMYTLPLFFPSSILATDVEFGACFVGYRAK